MALTRATMSKYRPAWRTTLSGKRQTGPWVGWGLEKETALPERVIPDIYHFIQEFN